MPPRLEVTKTYKLFIGGGFPRSESGRALKIADAKGRVIAHISHGSPKDLRNAVEAAAAAQPKWAGATAYNRGQVLYRMAEMIEARHEEFVDAIAVLSEHGRPAARREVDAAIDRLVCFAGWADKFAQVLGGANPVAGPYESFTVPEPVGVVGVVLPDEPALLGLVSLLAPPLCAGNAIVAVIGHRHPLAGVILGEVCATSDIPAGVVNIITGRRGELLDTLAGHREVGAIHAANLARKESTSLKLGAAENLKRVTVRKLRDDDWHDSNICDSPWTIEPFVDMKTTWHPAAT